MNIRDSVRRVAWLIAIESLFCIGTLMSCSFATAIPTTSSRQLFQPCGAPCRYNVSGFSLGQVIDAYGAPEKIAAFYLPIGEYQVLAVTLFYPSDGLTVLVSKRNPGNQLTPDFSVDEIAFWKSRSLSGLSEEFRLLNMPEAGQLSDWGQDWTGFGQIRGH